MQAIIGLVLLAVAVYFVWGYLFYVIGAAAGLVALGGVLAAWEAFKNARRSDEEYLALKKKEMLGKDGKESSTEQEISGDVPGFDEAKVLADKPGRLNFVALLIVACIFGYGADAAFSYQDEWSKEPSQEQVAEKPAAEQKKEDPVVEPEKEKPAPKPKKEEPAPEPEKQQREAGHKEQEKAWQDKPDDGGLLDSVASYVGGKIDAAKQFAGEVANDEVHLYDQEINWNGEQKIVSWYFIPSTKTKREWGLIFKDEGYTISAVGKIDGKVVAPITYAYKENGGEWSWGECELLDESKVKEGKWYEITAESTAAHEKLGLQLPMQVFEKSKHFPNVH